MNARGGGVMENEGRVQASGKKTNSLRLVLRREEMRAVCGAAGGAGFTLCRRHGSRADPCGRERGRRRGRGRRRSRRHFNSVLTAFR